MLALPNSLALEEEVVLVFLVKILKVIRKLFFKSRGIKEVNSLIQVKGGIEWSR